MGRKIQLHIKRLFDIIVSLLLILLFAPLMLFIALAIWVTMGRPILFRQPRIGYRGRVFTFKDEAVRW